LEGDHGGIHYQGKGHIEECWNPFYKHFLKEFNPSIIFDIGANYGVTGILFHKKFPNAKLIMAEPNPLLIDFIKHNCKLNNVDFYEVQNIAVSDKVAQIEFGLNLQSSQDSRVKALPGFHKINVQTETIDNLTNQNSNNKNVFIKIDTQGWEEQVFRGGLKFFTNHKNWFVRTEFAPKWLESQGNSAIDFLKFLTGNFNVFSMPWQNSLGVQFFE